MYQVHLDMLVPQDNFYRKLDAALNLHFLYKATSPTLSSYRFQLIFDLFLITRYVVKEFYDNLINGG